MDIIAERVFDFASNDGTTAAAIRVQMGRPELEPDGKTWRAPYAIVGPGSTDVWLKYTTGVDGLQALKLALHVLPLDLMLYQQWGSVTWLGQSDLRL